MKTPPQQGFASAAWDTAYGRILHPTDDDNHLYRCAKFFADQLDALRNQLKELPIPDGNPTQCIRRAVGAVNRECFAAQYSGAHLPEPKEAVYMTELVRREFPLARNVNMASSMNIVENVVDSLRLELSALGTRTNMDSLVSGSRAVQRIVDRINLAVFYNLLEEEWLECLHHGISVVNWNDGVALCPKPTDDYANDYAVGTYRSDSLDLELATKAEDYVDLDDNQWKGIVRHPDRKTEFMVVALSPEIRRFVLRNRFLASEPDLQPFVDRQVDRASGLTVSDMIEIWTAMAPLAHESMSRAPQFEYITSLNQLEQFAPVHYSSSLVRALQRITKLSTKKCTSAIEALSWRDVRDSLWHRPLVPLESGGKLLIVASALAAPNLRRSIEYWLALGGMDLAERGPLFEAQVRKDLTEGTRRNPLLSDAGFSESSVDPPDPTVGDIDLLGWIQDTVLIGEVKCLLRPATSHEWFKHEDSIRSAVAQVKRKARWLSENRPWLSQVVQHDFSATFKVVPCVVVNSPASALRLVEDVPIVDFRILYRFFCIGYGSPFVRLGSNTSLRKVSFYSNDEQASTALAGYLRAPPHLRMYRDSLELAVRWQPDFTTPNEWIPRIYPRVHLSMSTHLDGLADG